MPECSNVLPWKSMGEVRDDNNFNKMIYLIKSSVENSERRNLIRATWGSIFRCVTSLLNTYLWAMPKKLFLNVKKYFHLFLGIWSLTKFKTYKL